MLRKDVKFGLTIGGILVIVLVGYLAVVSRGPDKPRKPAVALVTGDPNATPPAGGDAAPADVAKPAAPSEPTPASGAPVLPNPDNSVDTANRLLANVAGTTPTPPAPAKVDAPDAPVPASADATAPAPAPAAVADAVTPSRTVTPAPGDAASATVRAMSWEQRLNGGQTPLFAAPAEPDRSAASDNVNGADVPAFPSPDHPPVVSGTGRRHLSSASAARRPAAAPDEPAALPMMAAAAAPAADATPAARPTADTPYKIQAGDTFSTISRKVYGSKRFYLKIAAANPGVDSTHLKIGQTITLPAIPNAEAAAPATDAPKVAASDKSDAAARKAIDGKSYEVQAGDTLSRICNKLYHNHQWNPLYELNKEAIGPNPAALKVGMVLKLPEQPLADASR